MDTVWVLGDQLNRSIGALAAADPARHRVLLVESDALLGNERWHRQRAHLVIASMRRFADELRGAGFAVDLRRSESLAGRATAHHCREHAPGAVLLTEPNSWAMRAVARRLGVTVVRSNQFLCHADEFAAWAATRKQLKMEDFYRRRRRSTGYLMDGDEPEGGRWNLDAENRQPPPPDTDRWPAPPRDELDDLDRAVLADLPADVLRRAARRHVGHQPRRRAAPARPLRRPRAAPVRAARGRDDHGLAGTSRTRRCRPYLNIGLLLPDEVCDAVAARVRRRPGAAGVGRGVHPPGDRLARVRVGRLLAVDARVPIGERAAAPTDRSRPCSPGARTTEMRCLADCLDGVARPRLQPPHPATDGARQPRAARRGRPVGDDRRGCGTASSTAPSG